jgi:uncharacterized membrane protein YidH (DUF202 family)
MFLAWIRTVLAFVAGGVALANHCQRERWDRHYRRRPLGEPVAMTRHIENQAT